MTMRASRLLPFLVVLLASAGWSAPVPAQAQKSAQGDCTREAQRRGFQVLSTRNYQYLRYGWSMDIEVRDPRGRVQTGTCFVEMKTGDVSLYGFGWGGGTSSNDYEFSCASSDEKYRECQLPVDGRARLVKQRSDAPCIEGRSWGQRGDRVWVDRGCRARFTVEPRGGGGGGGQQSQQRAQSACRNEAQHRGMNVQDVSSTEWSQSGRFWAATIKGTYQGRRTTAGCRWYPDRQRTEMNFGQGWSSGSGGWSGGGGSPAQAERACLNEAQRQGYSVIKNQSPYRTQSGYGMYLKVKRAGGPAVEGYCRYLRDGGRVQIEVFGPGRSAKGDPEVR